MAPTEKQRQIYEALLFLMEKGERPTVREVGSLVGLMSPATVMKHLRALEREGLLTLSGKSRGIKIIDARKDGEPTAPIESPVQAQRSGGTIPVLGRIAAGWPIKAIAEEEPPLLSMAPEVFSGGDLFALHVSGDSMIDAGILDGDYVIIRRQQGVEDGEIAAVDIDGEVTLKRWQRRPSSDKTIIRLKPANARFEPIVISEADNKRVRVLGKFVGLVRGDVRFS